MANTPKRKVLRRWPEAKCGLAGDGFYYVETVATAKRLYTVLGCGKSARVAWRRAEESLPLPTG